MKQLVALGAIFVFLCEITSTQAADIEAGIDADYDYVEKLYLDLHQAPELSFAEKETSKRLAREMKSAGFEVTQQVGGYGVVAVLKNGVGPTVLLRADMDALPVKEQTGLAYASKVTTKDQAGETVNVMHACGHDIHMSVWVGTARRLAAMKDYWHGTLVMIAQPAEERGAGARAMLKDGLFQRFPRPDFNLALHVNASLMAGEVGLVSGYALANVDSVDIEVRGEGGHGAWPHTTKDPVVLASQIVVALQTLVSRETSPLDSAVVTVGSIHGGTKHNIIGDNVHLQLTVRSYSDETRRHLLDGIARIARGQAIAAGLSGDKLPIVTVQDEFTPATYNDPDLTARIGAVFRDQFGANNVKTVSPVMGGEDFSQYGRVEPRIPSLMFWLGAVSPAKVGDANLPSLHSPFFAPEKEPALKTGIQAMTSAALNLLGVSGADQ